MPTKAAHQDRKIDDAAFGAIYGSITVMGVLAVSTPDALTAVEMAAMLFASILAVALAKAYADLAANVLSSGRPASWDMVVEAWRLGRTTLIAVNVPTLTFLGSALGLYDVAMAHTLAKFLAVSLLIFYGARIGFRLTGKLLPMVTGGGVAGAVGLSLALLKTFIH